MQEGCKFKHEIPEDEEMRRAIGFRAPPVWPRDEAGDVPTSPIRPAGGIHAKPAVTQQAWRRQGNNPGKVELPGAPNNSNRPAPQATPTASGPAFAHSPSNLAVQSLGTNTQYDAHAAYGATAFPAALPHFPSQSGHMTQHLPSHQAAQSFFNGTNAGHQSAFTGAAESYQQRSSQGKNHLAHSFNRGAHQTQTGSQASPTKQPPITRPMHLQQQSVGQHGNGPNSKPTSGYQILPRGSGHLTGARSASQDHALPSVVVKESDLQNLAGYISETTRSVTQSPYMPTNTPAGVSSSRVDTPSSSLGSAAFANHNATAFANNHNAPVHGNNNGSFSSQFQLHSPAPSTATGNGRRQDLFKVNVPASQAPSYQPQSPPPMHRRHFRAEGEPEYVTNPVEEVKGRSGNGAKKNNGHGKRNTNGGGKQGHGAKSKNPFEPLVDLGGQR